MPNKFQIVAATAIATLAFSEIYRVRPLRKRAQATKAAALVLSDVLDQRTEQLDYLIKLMQERDFELDEFDLIVLRNAVSQS